MNNKEIDFKNLKIERMAPARTTVARDEITGNMVIIENPEYTKIKRDLEGLQ